MLCRTRVPVSMSNLRDTAGPLVPYDSQRKPARLGRLSAVDEGSDPLAFSPTGFLWNNALASPLIRAPRFFFHLRYVPANHRYWSNSRGEHLNCARESSVKNLSRKSSYVLGIRQPKCQATMRRACVSKIG